MTEKAVLWSGDMMAWYNYDTIQIDIIEQIDVIFSVVLKWYWYVSWWHYW